MKRYTYISAEMWGVKSLLWYTIYIVIHRQTVSFYQNSSVWLDTQDARRRDRNPSNCTLDWVSDHSSTKRTTLAGGIYGTFIFRNSSSSSLCLHFFLYQKKEKIFSSLNSPRSRFFICCYHNACVQFSFGKKNVYMFELIQDTVIVIKMWHSIISKMDICLNLLFIHKFYR